MTASENLVSIITPCYNASQYIAQTIESVLNQRYHTWEMLIVDDSSTDNSAEIIQSYSNRDKRIKYLHTNAPSGSPALPRNIGLDNACGKYIAFLDADDVWMPEKLEEQVSFIVNNNYQFVYSNYEKMNSLGQRSHRFIVMPPQSSYWDVVETCTIPCLTALLDKEIIGENRFLNIPKEDFAFWLSILRKNIVAYNTGKVHAIYREQRESRSANKVLMIKNQWYVLREIEGVKRPVTLYFMFKYLYHGLLKYLK